MVTRFDTSLAFVLSREGGYVNDPSDHGGATNFGITQTVYNAFLAHDQRTLESVADIPMDDVHTIYRKQYWDACRCDDIPAPLDLAVFDSAVQHGTGRAVKWLQRAAGAVPDGQCGEMTLYAVHHITLAKGLSGLVDDYLDTRAAFYAQILARDEAQHKFARGWANRMGALRDAIA